MLPIKLPLVELLLLPMLGVVVEWRLVGVVEEEEVSSWKVEIELTEVTRSLVLTVSSFTAVPAVIPSRNKLCIRSVICSASVVAPKSAGLSSSVLA